MITAAEAIGEYQPQDWHLDPRSHAQRMTREAGPLQKLLQGSRVLVILEQYEAANAKAGEYQAEYKRYGRWEIYLGSAAAIIGAIILYLASVDGGEPGLPRTGLLIAQGICLAGAIAVKYKLSHSALYALWQQQRTRAETSRIELFETACGLAEHPLLPSVAENELPLLPLQLEYFLRYQLQVQLNYYHKRGRQHAEAGNQDEVFRFIRSVNDVISVEHTEWKERQASDDEPSTTA